MAHRPFKPSMLLVWCAVSTLLQLGDARDAPLFFASNGQDFIPVVDWALDDIVSDSDYRRVSTEDDQQQVTAVLSYGANADEPNLSAFSAFESPSPIPSPRRRILSHGTPAPGVSASRYDTWRSLHCLFSKQPIVDGKRDCTDFTDELLAFDFHKYAEYYESEYLRVYPHVYPAAFHPLVRPIFSSLWDEFQVYTQPDQVPFVVNAQPSPVLDPPHLPQILEHTHVVCSLVGVSSSDPVPPTAGLNYKECADSLVAQYQWAYDNNFENSRTAVYAFLDECVNAPRDLSEYTNGIDPSKKSYLLSLSEDGASVDTYLHTMTSLGPNVNVGYFVVGGEREVGTFVRPYDDEILSNLWAIGGVVGLNIDYLEQNAYYSATRPLKIPDPEAVRLRSLRRICPLACPLFEKIPRYKTRPNFCPPLITTTALVDRWPAGTRATTGDPAYPFVDGGPPTYPHPPADMGELANLNKETLAAMRNVVNATTDTILNLTKRSLALGDVQLALADIVVINGQLQEVEQMRLDLEEDEYSRWAALRRVTSAVLQDTPEAISVDAVESVFASFGPEILPLPKTSHVLQLRFVAIATSIATVTSASSATFRAPSKTAADAASDAFESTVKTSPGSSTNLHQTSTQTDGSVFATEQPLPGFGGELPYGPAPGRPGGGRALDLVEVSGFLPRHIQLVEAGRPWSELAEHLELTVNVTRCQELVFLADDDSSAFSTLDPETLVHLVLNRRELFSCTAWPSHRLSAYTHLFHLEGDWENLHSSPSATEDLAADSEGVLLRSIVASASREDFEEVYCDLGEFLTSPTDVFLVSRDPDNKRLRLSSSEPNDLLEVSCYPPDTWPERRLGSRSHVHIRSPTQVHPTTVTASATGTPSANSETHTLPISAGSTAGCGLVHGVVVCLLERTRLVDPGAGPDPAVEFTTDTTNGDGVWQDPDHPKGISHARAHAIANELLLRAPPPLKLDTARPQWPGLWVNNSDGFVSPTADNVTSADFPAVVGTFTSLAVTVTRATMKTRDYLRPHVNSTSGVPGVAQAGQLTAVFAVASDAFQLVRQELWLLPTSATQRLQEPDSDGDFSPRVPLPPIELQRWTIRTATAVLWGVIGQPGEGSVDWETQVVWQEGFHSTPLGKDFAVDSEGRTFGLGLGDLPRGPLVGWDRVWETTRDVSCGLRSVHHPADDGTQAQATTGTTTTTTTRTVASSFLCFTVDEPVAVTPGAGNGPDGNPDPLAGTPVEDFELDADRPPLNLTVVHGTPPEWNNVSWAAVVENPLSGLVCGLVSNRTSVLCWDIVAPKWVDIPSVEFINTAISDLPLFTFRRELVPLRATAKGPALKLTGKRVGSLGSLQVHPTYFCVVEKLEAPGEDASSTSTSTNADGRTVCVGTGVPRLFAGGLDSEHKLADVHTDDIVRVPRNTEHPLTDQIWSNLDELADSGAGRVPDSIGFQPDLFRYTTVHADNETQSNLFSQFLPPTSGFEDYAVPVQTLVGNPNATSEWPGGFQGFASCPSDHRTCSTTASDIQLAVRTFLTTFTRGSESTASPFSNTSVPIGNGSAVDTCLWRDPVESILAPLMVNAGSGHGMLLCRDAGRPEVTDYIGANRMSPSLVSLGTRGGTELHDWSRAWDVLNPSLGTTYLNEDVLTNETIPENLRSADNPNAVNNTKLLQQLSHLDQVWLLRPVVDSAHLVLTFWPATQFVEEVKVTFIPSRGELPGDGVDGRPTWVMNIQQGSRRGYTVSGCVVFGLAKRLGFTDGTPFSGIQLPDVESLFDELREKIDNDDIFTLYRSEFCSCGGLLDWVHRYLYTDRLEEVTDQGLCLADLAGKSVATRLVTESTRVRQVRLDYLLRIIHVTPGGWAATYPVDAWSDLARELVAALPSVNILPAEYSRAATLLRLVRPAHLYGTAFTLGRVDQLSSAQMAILSSKYPAEVPGDALVAIGVWPSPAAGLVIPLPPYATTLVQQWARTDGRLLYDMEPVFRPEEFDLCHSHHVQTSSLVASASVSGRWEWTPASMCVVYDTSFSRVWYVGQPDPDPVSTPVQTQGLDADPCTTVETRFVDFLAGKRLNGTVLPPVETVVGTTTQEGFVLGNETVPGTTVRNVTKRTPEVRLKGAPPQTGWVTLPEWQEKTAGGNLLPPLKIQVCAWSARSNRATVGLGKFLTEELVNGKLVQLNRAASAAETLNVELTEDTKALSRTATELEAVFASTGDKPSELERASSALTISTNKTRNEANVFLEAMSALQFYRRYRAHFTPGNGPEKEADSCVRLFDCVGESLVHGFFYLASLLFVVHRSVVLVKTSTKKSRPSSYGPLLPATGTEAVAGSSVRRSALGGKGSYGWDGVTKAGLDSNVGTHQTIFIVATVAYIVFLLAVGPSMGTSFLLVLVVIGYVTALILVLSLVSWAVN